MKYYNDDIAIVSYSALFPSCEDEDVFFDSLLDGRCLLYNMIEGESSKETSHLRYHFSKDKKEKDKFYSSYGAKISLENILKWREKNNLSKKEATTIEIILHELLARIEEKTPQMLSRFKSECIVAMSTGEPDPIKISQKKNFAQIRKQMELSSQEVSRVESFFDEFKEHPQREEFLLKDAFSTLIFSSVRDRFGIDGSCCFVDAACASSLAAIMLSVNRLRHKKSEVVITGGVDVGNNLMTLLAFSKLQILSDEKMNPFDKGADGMNQGEGASLFALMRMDLAKKENLPIVAVIRNCDGSSDGMLGGMVEPTEYGQNLAYERAYQSVPMHPLTYLECHGTGTQLGDKTELSSTSKFFHPLPPIGSVKANVGHTIAAAGAASLAKSLKIIEKRVIPKHPSLKKLERKWPHQIPTENLRIDDDEKIRVGISSFGFGGANFHMVVDEYQGEPLSQSRSEKEGQSHFKFVLNAEEEIDLNFVYELFSSSKYKIPPLSLGYADPLVLGGVLAAEKLFNSLKVPFSQRQKEKIGVISNSNSYLSRLIDCYERLSYLEVFRRFDSKDKEREFTENKMPNDLTVTEDTFMWALNNLIAGRVTKSFDLKGPNFNIAGERVSLGLTLSHVEDLLRTRSGAYIIVSADEHLPEGEFHVDRQKVKALFVSDLQFSLESNLPIKKEIVDIRVRRKEQPRAGA